ncbi:MAG: hypothetical protein IJ570_04600 [Prevotella sp.]|nr:hypothetical protein [Prevotella sp.]
MRRRIPYRVCQCTPNGIMTHLEARLLKDLVNREIRPIRCASTCARKAQKGLYLGNLCAEAHHPMWALKIWKFTLSQIHSKDYDDWIDVCFNTKYVRLRDVISDGICEIIGSRIDVVERSMGLSDARGRDSWEYWAGDGWYNSFFYEKYDSDWDSVRDTYIEMRNEAIELQHLNRFFHEVQGEVPVMAQNFFDYWNDYDPATQEDFYFKIDDWD